ncbi:MAG: hypothetical protein ACXW32_04700 [Limisphaerales bacterium]
MKNTLFSRMMTLCAPFLGAASLAAADLGADLPPPSGHDYEVPKAGSYQLPRIQVAANGKVIDHTGQTLSLEKLTRGRVTVLSFIYTRCASASACPYATGVLNQLHPSVRKTRP